MLASGSTAAWIVSAASVTSASVRSGPPETFSSTPCAPSIETSSSGLEIAARAALTARLSPRASPTAISAVPAFCITALTSAKSRLIRPVIVTRSLIPCTPWRSTSSASRNASMTLIWRSASCSRRSFGITISASTLSRSRVRPSSAALRRLKPSKPNGSVTTATVSARAWRAMSAMIGAAPVPVPPPRPAVRKIMSAPSITSVRASRLISAARSPACGSPPAPRPLAARPPIGILRMAEDICSACASVLTAMNSTPWSPASTMRLTALPPPPPTPMILTSVNPRACDSWGASTICGTTDTVRVRSAMRSGLKPPRWRPLGTRQHLVREREIRLDRFFCTCIVEHRSARRTSLQDLAVGANLGAEDAHAPALAEVVGDLTLFLETPVHLAQQDTEHLQARIQIQDLLDAFFQHLQTLQGEKPRFGGDDDFGGGHQRI